MCCQYSLTAFLPPIHPRLPLCVCDLPDSHPICSPARRFIRLYIEISPIVPQEVLYGTVCSLGTQCKGLYWRRQRERDFEEQERGREAGEWGSEETITWAVLTAAGMEGDKKDWWVGEKGSVRGAESKVDEHNKQISEPATDKIR